MRYVICNIYISNKLFNLNNYNYFIWKKNNLKKHINKNLLFSFFKIYYYTNNLKKIKNKSNIRRLNMYLIFYSDFNKINTKKINYVNNNINTGIYNTYNILLNNINII